MTRVLGWDDRFVTRSRVNINRRHSNNVAEEEWRRVAGPGARRREVVGYFFVRASTPGSFLPSRNSSDAPPPVEMWVIWSATPAFFTAETESPPPTMEMASWFAATALATFVVPAANAGSSKTPMGPFQTMVEASAISFENNSTVLGP